MRRLFASSWRHRPVGGHTSDSPRNAFTLVELLVAVVILTILASLSLAGLAGVRQRGKADKTRSTIRKIDSVIRPMYESYHTRRVNTLNDNGSKAASTLEAAANRLKNIRRLMMYEMPDVWADVAASGTHAPPGLPTPSSPELLSLCRNGTTRSYGSLRAGNPTAAYGSAECLFMILTRSGFEPESLENFRSDELTDIDSDGAREFSDGWGRPIAFLRWAPGFSSPYSQIQFADPSQYHDPIDPMRRDATAFALVPLIFSAGPDEASNDPLSQAGPSGYGILQIDKDTGWNAAPVGLLNICQARDAANAAFIGAPDPDNSSAYRDNITNHDLSRR